MPNGQSFKSVMGEWKSFSGQSLQPMRNSPHTLQGKSMAYLGLKRKCKPVGVIKFAYLFSRSIISLGLCLRVFEYGNGLDIKNPFVAVQISKFHLDTIHSFRSLLISASYS